MNVSEHLVEFYDDISGKKLETSRVIAARKEELKIFKEHGVYHKVPEEKALRMTRKKPIGVRWLDTNKGDEATPEYRSRLVAKEIKRNTLDEMVAATPPLSQETPNEYGHNQDEGIAADEASGH